MFTDHREDFSLPDSFSLLTRLAMAPGETSATIPQRFLAKVTSGPAAVCSPPTAQRRWFSDPFVLVLTCGGRRLLLPLVSDGTKLPPMLAPTEPRRDFDFSSDSPKQPLVPRRRRPDVLRPSPNVSLLVPGEGSRVGPSPCAAIADMPALCGSSRPGACCMQQHNEKTEGRPAAQGQAAPPALVPTSVFWICRFPPIAEVSDNVRFSRLFR